MSRFALALTVGAHIMPRMLYWGLPVAFWVLMFFVFLGITAVRGMPTRG